MLMTNQGFQTASVQTKVRGSASITLSAFSYILRLGLRRTPKAAIRIAFAFLLLLFVLCLGAAVGARAQKAPTAPRVDNTAFHPRSFGVDIDTALVNPLDGTMGQAQLRQEVAVVMHDIRAIGGTTARWFVTDVWPQWRCSRDPEDQTSGQIDPGWFVVARTLLEEAQRYNVKVDVVLGDLAPGSVGFNGVSDSPPADRENQIRRWAAHRLQGAGKDGYSNKNIPACSGTVGYYGATQLKDLFARPAIRARLAHRDVEMARFLSQFPALGAVELFNEPDFNFTQTAEYWSAIRELEKAVRAASPRMASVQVISGTAWWNPKIAQAAMQANVLAQEPFITVHNYQDYSKDSGETELRGLLNFIRHVVPGKPVVIAEAGSKKPLRSLAENRRMVQTLINAYVNQDVGVWVWGSYFAGPESNDFKWMFNDRSPAGASFRSFFFDPQKEQEYSKPKKATLSDQGTQKSFPITVSQIPDSDPVPAQWGQFALSVGDIHFIGFSRAGVFPRPFPGHPELFASPPPTFFISAPNEPARWAEIAYGDSAWTLRVFACEAVASAPGTTATPDVLLGLADTRKRTDFAKCIASHPLISGKL